MKRTDIESHALVLFSRDLIPFLATKCRGLELVPLPGAELKGGQLPLALARSGTALAYAPEEESWIPTLDLARAGITMDSQPPSALIEAAAHYLAGKTFSVKPSQAIDFDFFYSAIVSDKWEAFMMMLDVNVTCALAENRYSRRPGMDVELNNRVEGHKRKLGLTLEIVPECDPLPGLDLSEKLLVFRRNFMNEVLAPKGTPERVVLESCMEYIGFFGENSGREDCLEEARKHWWFWPTEWLVKRRADAAWANEELARRSKLMDEALIGFFPQ